MLQQVMVRGERREEREVREGEEKGWRWEGDVVEGEDSSKGKM